MPAQISSETRAVIQVLHEVILLPEKSVILWEPRKHS